MENKGQLPASIVGGETIWLAAANTLQTGSDIVLSDYTPAGGYTLAYQFAADTPQTVAAAANGDDTGWTLEVTGVQTLLWTPGAITFAGMATHTATSRVFAVDAGSIRVAASPLRQSSWKVALAACDAAIASFAGGEMSSFTIDGQSYSYRSLSQLIDLRAWLFNMVQKDQSGRQKRIIRSRFP